MKRLYSITVLVLLFTNIVLSNTISSDKNSIKLLNIINHQRMLSQQITKAYIYAGKGIATEYANKEIKKSLQEFKNSYTKANTLTKNKKLKRVISFVKKSANQFSVISKKPINKKNTKLMLSISESILNKSEQIISSLQKEIKHKNSEFILLLGQEGMLAQRVAKYYIAYQTNKSKKAKSDIKRSIKLFNRNHKKLMRYKKKNPNISKNLNEIDRLWRIVHSFSNNIEDGKLPLIVFETTDKITNAMNELIKVYTKEIK